MGEKDDLKALIGELEKHIRPESTRLYEMMREKDRLITSIINGFPCGRQALDFSTTIMDNRILAKVAPMLKDACSRLKKKSELKGGYTIELRDKFTYRFTNIHGWTATETYSGPTLTLLTPKKEQVGALQFDVGFPFVITVLQGQGDHSKKTNRPRDFFRATGMPYTDALMWRFINDVGAAVHFHRGDPFRDLPKAKLMLLTTVIDIKPETKKRVAQFMDKEHRNEFIKSDSMDRPHVPVSERFFRRAWIRAHHSEKQGSRLFFQQKQAAVAR